MRSVRAFLVFASVVTVGCQPKETGSEGLGADAGGGGGSTSALRISTETLASGQVGATYSQALAARGGSPPYGWSIATKPAGLGWLSVNASSGVLTGAPGAGAPEGLTVTVAVTDQTATTAKKDFLLKVAGCREGEIVVCASADAGVCLTGSQKCAQGQLEGGCAGAPSADVARCGAACGACGETANACVGGECKCGTGAPCVPGDGCCAGQCKKLDDARSCGSCDNDCTTRAGAFVSASCALGQCSFACAVETGHTHQHCVGSVPTPPANGVSCETDVATDMKNCGTCQHDCTPTSQADRDTTTSIACTTGNCLLTCKPQLLDCDAISSNGCETPFSTSNCGQCGKKCQAGANQTVTGCSAQGVCQYACQPGYGDCDSDAARGSAGNGCETNLWQHDGCGNSCTGRIACAAEQKCLAGACACSQADAPCGAGTHCGATSNRCECDSTTCTGCCTQLGVGGVCVGGASTGACGLHGGLCRTCATTGCPTKCKFFPNGNCTCDDTAAEECRLGVCGCKVDGC